MSAYYTGDWNPHTFDSLFECTGWAVGWTIRLSSLALAFCPTFAPLIPAAMKAADVMDWTVAVLRIGTSSFLTMPMVLGTQFDTMRVYTLGYQAVYRGADVSFSLTEEILPAFIPGASPGPW
jgi:hypothetical protein